MKWIPETMKIMQKRREVTWKHNGGILLQVAISRESQLWFQLNHMKYHLANPRIWYLHSECIYEESKRIHISKERFEQKMQEKKRGLSKNKVQEAT